MKKAAMKMSIMMSVTMSFVLSLVGNLSSGRFTLPGWLTGFLISLVIGLVIGFVVPMRKTSTSLIKKANAPQGGLKARVIESAVSSLLYTPLMTFIMVFMAYKNATAHGAMLKFGPMLLRSEFISIIVAFILSFIITPIYTKIAFKDVKRPKSI
ncbi:MAG: hypothetical protein IJ115_08485 [Erysipelotrichaceae bacterium]|nr:hypothetical protein [Erysipelotrichaceae bacterium]